MKAKTSSDHASEEVTVCRRIANKASVPLQGTKTTVGEWKRHRRSCLEDTGKGMLFLDKGWKDWIEPRLSLSNSQPFKDPRNQGFSNGVEKM